MSIVIGVDPGAAGAFVGLFEDGRCAFVWTADGKGERGEDGAGGYYRGGEPDIVGLVARLNPLRDTGVLAVVIEEPMCPRASGTSTALTMGRSWGLILGALLIARMPVQRVTAAKWSADMFRGKKGNTDREKKDAGIKLCMERLPTVPLIPAGCRAAHTGIADAALIAAWRLR
jgi:hypothetical protein